ncbi:MAG TPA: 30S ribosomal protein S27ae [Nitrososphaerales archaeon]|nr:30S ribosomal protein S27ae [Nitrososphaerales archaeon]HLQ20930.1 30S ribosomal protein S27ae [Nitrososphaerales archaeon]
MSKQQPAPSPPPPAKTPAPAPAAPAPAGAEEKKPEKKEKPKAPKRRIQVWKLYKLEGDKATRLRRECPRCGRGYFMAEHKNRLSCGNCGYTMYTKS